MNENEIGVCPFLPEKNEEILAHDGARFSEPFFSEAKELLGPLSRLNFGAKSLSYPPNYEEDLVQSERRLHFDINEWIIVALSIDEGTALTHVLLVDRHHHQEGYVIDMKEKAVTASFYRGFAIKESPDAPLLLGEEFLLSIGFKNEIENPVDETPLFFDLFGDMTEGFTPHPVFEATGKKKILNLGSSQTPETEVQEDEEGEIHIEVERSSFEAGGHKKPQNLGSAPETFFDEEDAPVSIEVSKPTFEARGNKKPRNLNATPDRPRKVSNPVKAPSTQEEKSLPPSFEPQKKIVVANLDIKPASPSAKVLSHDEPKIVAKDIKPEAIESPVFVAGGKKEIVNYDHVVEKENREWSAIDVYKLRPDVYHRERAVLADPHDDNSLRLCKKVQSLLTEKKTLPVSSRLVFVPSSLSEGDIHFRPLRHFEMKEWDLLAITVNYEDDPLLAMISNKAETSFVLVVSFRKEVLVEVLSLQGAALDDRALPYLSFSQIRKIVFPN